mmetsp:Transcript_93611/g.180585  ORF Transcript_93611/g.180585 Transcript_93611/m.180585 type:complete len:627 (+) Transcript_93611:89-1969(+)
MPSPPVRAEPTEAESEGLNALFAPAARRSKTPQPSSLQRADEARGVGAPLNAEELSQRYQDSNRLERGDRIVDGFCDHIFDGILVSKKSDDRLKMFLAKARKKLAKASDPVTSLMVKALLVSEASGRCGSQAGEIAERCVQRLREHRMPSGQVLLGALLGEHGHKKKKLQGAALVRHRALLFKVLVDSLARPLECTLERDMVEMTAWNIVQHNKVSYVVDLMHDPGTLYEIGSAKQEEYLNLLKLTCGQEFLSISMRSELTGHVPRPPWHAECSELNYGHEKKDRLGAGGFGEVFRGTWADTKVAIKVVKDKDPTDYDVMEFILEIALLARLNHPNVMRFWRGTVELSSGQRSLLMVTEFIERGGLSTLLHGHDGPKLPEALTLPQAIVLSLGIAHGMQYLHSCDVLHLDLKSPNVLIAGNWTPKLCDFGLAKVKVARTEDGYQTTLRGVSPVWAPPEMFDDEANSMTEKADVYSYGIVFFEVITRQLPFQEIAMRELPQAKFEGVLPRIPREVPEDCAAFLRSCCSARPSVRPTMNRISAQLREFALARSVDLSQVVMPAFRGSVKPTADSGADQQMSERLVRLRRERATLQAQLEAHRDRRSRLRESQLAGTTVPEEQSLPVGR